MDSTRSAQELPGHTDASTTMVYTPGSIKGGVASGASQIAFPVPLPTSLLGSRLMLQAGLDNKAVGAAALPPKPPQPRGDRRPGEIGPLPD
ncbi:hypothetical protein CLG94_04190 [Candidatus Methylomirabilis limnetica]|jgi:hypothetical protein|uniref:Uncharacterized protein n=1 Tax=Candidatus Methylomirabilis limnetica TaxID=2033718 RepID=A0A2T4TZL3_9BACT|nr:hypothetical protein [Candidatus Methylomirabilis limnetica]PTL36554.1 hypothetical protein CLG94_04190 [Candidatus Methylomirabilis limnetica]